MSKHSKETARLQKIVESFPNVTITVVGDMVADEFVFGEISRVSREAPVLILRHRERTVTPGGGANAASNLADLGVNVLPVGVVGDDEPGRLLLRGFRHKHIPVVGVLKDKSYATVTKTRISRLERVNERTSGTEKAMRCPRRDGISIACFLTVTDINRSARLLREGLRRSHSEQRRRQRALGTFSLRISG